MGKTISCDICGKTQEQLTNEGKLLNRIYRFKTDIFAAGRMKIKDGELGLPSEFYICPYCLEAVRESTENKTINDYISLTFEDVEPER